MITKELWNTLIKVRIAELEAEVRILRAYSLNSDLTIQAKVKVALIEGLKGEIK